MMSKAKTKAEPITEVVVEYDLFDLPTAQHKAGLAGLLVQLGSMAKRALLPDGIPEVVERSPTRAKIRFTEKSVRALFDDLYAAKPGRVDVKSPWKNAKLIEERIDEEVDPETKKPKKVKHFVYEVVQPCGHFLRDHYPDEDGAWLKLWRDMLWAIPRGNPQARAPFEQRAAGKACKEGGTAWADLVKYEAMRQRGGIHITDVAGSLWLGAQAFNAESIPFQGRAEQNLLLHFWPLAVLIFVPQQIDADGESTFPSGSYALAIPEVADLENFCEDFPQMLRNLSPGLRGYRPAESVIDLPAEGALSFLEHMARLADRLAAKGEWRYTVSSVEFMHLVKLGNNIKSMAAGRVPADDPNLTLEYRRIVGKPGAPPPYRNPLFRRGLLLALLHSRPWYEPLAPTLAQHPWPIFVQTEGSPRNLPWFWQDARAKFEALSIAHQEELEIPEMSKTTEAPAAKPDTPLPLLIHRLVQSYVLRKTEEKSGLKWDDFKDKKVKDEKTGRERIDVPKPYSEAKEKVASGTFLEMRSRRDQDFVDHFTATFCSVPQRLREEDFRIVAEALLTQHEAVKTLTLLALSANS
jgi:CRISPR-associated protein Cmx8